MRAGHAGEVGVEACAVGRTDDALDDHRHLLLLQPVGRHLQVGLGPLGEGRGEHPLDGRDQLDQPRLRVRRGVGQHEGLVDAGERLVGRVLQQAR